MTKIRVTIEASCASHPLLRAGASLPRTAEIELTPQKLFGFATLSLQKPVDGWRSYAETYRLWESLNALHGDFLQFSDNNLTATVCSDDLIRLSEYVGVGCGIAVLCEHFDVDISRFTKFAPGGNKKRADFEFYSQQDRYFHETKGTTNKYDLPDIRKTIEGQKKGTRNFCTSNIPTAKAITGSITLYRQSSRTNFDSEVILLDPPAPAGANRRILSDNNAELISVINYYQNIYAATYKNPRNVRGINFATWLRKLTDSLIKGHPPTTEAPGDLFIQPRTHERGPNGSIYGGSIFDSRIAKRSILKYGDFDAASIGESAPIRFVGVSEEVSSLLQKCRWEQLLRFRSTVDFTDGKLEEAAILTSGVMIRDLERTDQIDIASRTAFNALRKKYGHVK